MAYSSSGEGTKRSRPTAADIAHIDDVDAQDDAVVRAILTGDVERAGESMREHLAGSSALLRGSCVDQLSSAGGADAESSVPLLPDPPAADRGAGRELARRGARGGGATVSGSAGAVIRSIALARSAAVGGVAGVAGVGAVRVREGRFDDADADGFEARAALAELSAAVESLGDEASAVGVAAARVLCAGAVLRADVAGLRLAAGPATAALGGSVTVLSSETRGARSSGAEGASPDVSAPALAEGVPLARVALDGTELAGAELAAPELAGPELVVPELAGTELVAPELAGTELVALELAGTEPSRTALVGPAVERSAVVVGGVTTGGAAVVDGDAASAGPTVPVPLLSGPLLPEPLLAGPLFGGPPVPGPPFPRSPWSRPSCA